MTAITRERFDDLRTGDRSSRKAFALAATIPITVMFMLPAMNIPTLVGYALGVPVTVVAFLLALLSQGPTTYDAEGLHCVTHDGLEGVCVNSDSDYIEISLPDGGLVKRHMRTVGFPVDEDVRAEWAAPLGRRGRYVGRRLDGNVLIEFPEVGIVAYPEDGLIREDRP